VFLVGGSSRIPLLGQLVQEQVERTPIEGGDPGTAVADGAAEYARARVFVRPNGSDGGDKGTDGGGTGAGGRGKGTDGGDDGTGTEVGGGGGDGWRRGIPVRTVLGALAAVLVLVVGVIVIQRLPIGAWPSGSGSTTSAVATHTVATSPPPDPARGVGDLLLAGCESSASEDCKQQVQAASRAAWPAMPSMNCAVHGPLYSTDRYSAECGTNGLSYLVFWRGSGLIAPALVNQMLMPTLRDFVLPNSTAKLGSQAFGTRPTRSGERFTCVWEYASYPVTMVIDGPNDNATLSLCATATFLDPAELESVVEPG
jgi:hypothetical protein